VLNTETLEPVEARILEAISLDELLMQNMSGERFMQIPEEKQTHSVYGRPQHRIGRRSGVCEVK